MNHHSLLFYVRGHLSRGQNHSRMHGPNSPIDVLSTHVTHVNIKVTIGDECDWSSLSGSAAELRVICTGQYPEHPAHVAGQASSLHAYSLLEQLLTVEPHNRITASTALRHPFFIGRE